MKHSSDNGTDKILRIPEGVTEVNGEHLLGRSDWVEIHIPKSVTKVAERAFIWGCPQLKKLIIENLDIEFDRYALRDCGFPEGLSFQTARYACEKGFLFNANKTVLLYSWLNEKIIKQIRTTGGYDLVIPDNVREISTDKNNSYPVGMYPFGDYSGCIRTLTLPKSLVKIGMNAFGHCDKLTEVIIPEGVEEISKGAFANCSNLRKVVFPNSLKMIRECAFAKCTKLKEAEIPNGAHIEPDAFHRCPDLPGHEEDRERIKGEAFEDIIDCLCMQQMGVRVCDEFGLSQRLYKYCLVNGLNFVSFDCREILSEDQEKEACTKLDGADIVLIEHSDEYPHEQEHYYFLEWLQGREDGESEENEKKCVIFSYAPDTDKTGKFGVKSENLFAISYNEYDFDGRYRNWGGGPSKYMELHALWPSDLYKENGWPWPNLDEFALNAGNDAAQGISERVFRKGLP